MFDSSIVGNISAFIAFVEGLISFFSPCVIPLLPIYLSYLSGNLEEEKVSRKKTLLFTLTFILGIFTALLMLNASITWISSFFTSASSWIMRIGGIFIILLGLMQMGLFKIPFFERTFNIKYSFTGKRMSLPLAFVMGFTFSFSWTPCIGPALTSILIMASNSGSFMTSMLLVSAYAIGFALPFLIISFFSKPVMNFFRKYSQAMQVIVKIGGIILILMGSLMFFGKLGSLGAVSNTETPNEQENAKNNNGEVVSAPNFNLNDQHGNTINLTDYEGKIIYINFWGTWCSACKSELPDIQKLYDTYKDSDEVQVLTLVKPGGQEKDIDGIKAFLEENNITFPVLFDTNGVAFSKYGITSFPTLFMIDKEQKVFGYLPGVIKFDTMVELIDMVREGKRPSEK